ncbi:MAG: proline/glycine betaine ABC transporter permease [Actinobacteria bacterium]|nr:proline/glycine betaine ABC transporter permease [Actinomycetota bacterium]
MFELPRIHIGDWVESVVEWLTDNFGLLFDLIDYVIGALIGGLEDLLAWPPPFLLAAIFALIAWRVRGVGFGVFTLASFALIDSIRLWDDALLTLSLVLVSSLIAVAIGIPAGIAAGRSTAVGATLRPALDFMQTMPAFVYLIPAIIFFGIGTVPGAVATIVFAMPPAVRLTELGIQQVDKEVVEAGHAFGSAPAQILSRIQIPLAMPTIMAGVNQVIMLALSMVVIAGIVGAGGLGAVVFRGITRLNIGLGFEGGLAVVILAIFLDRVTAAIGDKSSARVAAATAK